MVVLLGAHDLGRWQRREVNLALDRQTTVGDQPVIPVLLAGAEPSPGFLTLNTWIDFRDSLDDEDVVGSLIAAVRGEPPGPIQRTMSERALSAASPYRGLRAFEEQDAAFFHGRSAFSQRLHAAVGRSAFTCVVGPSGSGKSSVVHAGLVPLLRREAETIWDVVSITPTAAPMKAVAGGVLPLLEPEMTETDRLVETKKLADHLAAGDVSLGDVVQRCLEKQPGTDRLLLVIDQWEEIYSLVSDRSDRNRFIEVIVESVRSGVLSVVLTLRSDFFDEALTNRKLADCLQDAVVNISGMTSDELRRAIEEPAAQLGVGFESGLVDRILEDVGTEPGNLPLLEFVLAELWESRKGGFLLHEVYNAMGGVQGAIALRADEAFESMSNANQDLLRRLLLKLVAPGPSGEYTRRRAQVEDLGSDVAQPLQELIDARLLVAGRDSASGADTVEVAHEALIANWERLGEWLEQDRDFLRWRQRLDSAHEAWLHAGRDRDALLHGLLLSEARHWVRVRPEGTSRSEMEFIEASVRDSRRASRLRTLALVAVSVIALVAVFFAVQADRAANETQLQLADALVGDAQFLLATGAVEEAAIGLTESYAIDPSEAAVRVMNDIVNGHATWGTSIGAPGEVTATRVAVDWDAGMGAVAGADNLAVFDVASGQLLGDLPVSATVVALEFVETGSLAAGDLDGVVRLWDIDAGTSVEVDRYEAAVADVAAGPNGTIVAGTATVFHSYAPEGSGWTRLQTYPIAELDSQRRVDIRRVAVSNDGRTLVTVGSPQMLAWWDLETGQLLGHEINPNGRLNVLAAAFSPDDAYLAAGLQDRTVIVYDAATFESIQQTRPLGGQQRSLSFTPSGAHLVSSGQDGLLAWEVRGGLLEVPPSEISSTTAVATHHHELAPDGSFVIAAVTDRIRRYDIIAGNRTAPTPNEFYWDVAATGETAWIGGHTALHWWDVESGEAASHAVGEQVISVTPAGTPEQVYYGTGSGNLGVANRQTFAHAAVHGDRVWAIDLSADGDVVMTVSADNTIGLWAPDTLSALTEPFGPDSGGASGLKSFAFVDDREAVTVGGDGLLRLWDLTTAEELMSVVIVEGNEANAVVPYEDRVVIVGDNAGDVSIVDLDTGAIQRIEAHTAAVRGLALSPDGLTLASASEDNTVRLWSTATWEPVAVLHHPGAMRAVRFVDEGRRVVGVGQYGTAVVWNADWASWPALLCDRLTQWDMTRSWSTVMGDATFDPVCDDSDAE